MTEDKLYEMAMQCVKRSTENLSPRFCAMSSKNRRHCTKHRYGKD